MPLVVEFEFEDGEKKIERIPAEIWRKNAEKVSKIFVFDKAVKRVVLDPHHELVDANYDNNTRYAPMIFEKIEVSAPHKNPPNPMQEKKTAEEMKQKEKEIEGEVSDEPESN